MSNEIRATGSEDQILGYDPYRYELPDREDIFEMMRDEEENDYWAATEVPHDNLLDGLEKVS